MVIFSFLADIFGIVLNWLYNLLGQSYGWAIIGFTLLVRIIILPITFKQQQSVKKTAKIQNEMKSIQFKYKNNPEQMNKEVMELYKKEKISPFSGCLSAILQIIIIISVFTLVSKPLSHMVKIDKQYPEENLINKYKDEIANENGKNSNYYEIEIIQKKANQDDRVKINMDFLGLDLSKVPSSNMKDPTVYIIPALYIVSSFLSMRVATDNKKKPNKNAIGDGTEKTSDAPDMTQEMSKNMSFIMPIMTASIAFIAPLGLALYWFISNVLMILEKIIINKYVDSKGEK